MAVTGDAATALLVRIADAGTGRELLGVEVSQKMAVLQFPSAPLLEFNLSGGVKGEPLNPWTAAAVARFLAGELMAAEVAVVANLTSGGRKLAEDERTICDVFWWAH